MGEDEEKGFVIRDKRGRAGDQPAQEPSPGLESASEMKIPPNEPETAEDLHSSESAPPVTFASFIFSLGSSALMLMGEPLSPDYQNPPVNLPQAKEIIDILSMLETKTQGNLASEEQKVLSDMLYALRMKYVDLVSGKSGTASS